MFLIVGEIVVFDIPDVMPDGAGDLFMEAKIAAEEAGLKFGIDTQQVVHDQHLAIAIFSRTDADHGNMKGLGALPGQERGYFFQDYAGAARIFKQLGVTF